MSTPLLGFAGALFGAWGFGLALGFFFRRVELAVTGVF